MPAVFWVYIWGNVGNCGIRIRMCENVSGHSLEIYDMMCGGSFVRHSGISVAPLKRQTYK